MENNKAVLFELNIENDRCIFPNTISDAIIDANKELKDLEDKLNETLETIRLLTPECDKLDYILSASSGALCGIIDVFLVGKPGIRYLINLDSAEIQQNFAGGVAPPDKVESEVDTT